MMPRRLALPGLAVVGVALGLSLHAGCILGSNPVKETVSDAGSPAPLVDAAPTEEGASRDAGPSDCFTNPQTHEEIINACTDAVKITKNPTLPALLADGGLPPLP